MGRPQSHLSALSPSRKGPAAADPRRVLSGLRLSSQGCHPVAQWSPAPAASAETEEADLPLWATRDRHPLSNLGGRPLPLGSAAERPAPSVDALGQTTLSHDSKNRSATWIDQPQNHRCEAQAEETPTAEESLRPDQARQLTQASHAQQARLLGRHPPPASPRSIWSLTPATVPAGHSSTPST